MSASNIIIIILIIVVLFLDLWVFSLEKALDNLETSMRNYMRNSVDWREEQSSVNRDMLQMTKGLSENCFNLEKQSNEMLETQKKLTELGNETYTKYLEVQAQIYGIKFEIEQKDLVAEYCKNDVVATEAVLIDEEEEQ